MLYNRIHFERNNSIQFTQVQLYVRQSLIAIKVIVFIYKFVKVFFYFCRIWEFIVVVYFPENFSNIINNSIVESLNGACREQLFIHALFKAPKTFYRNLDLTFLPTRAQSSKRKMSLYIQRPPISLRLTNFGFCGGKYAHLHFTIQFFFSYDQKIIYSYIIIIYVSRYIRMDIYIYIYDYIRRHFERTILNMNI